VFEAAISTYRPDLIRWAIGRVGVDDAEDLVQDTLLRTLVMSHDGSLTAVNGMYLFWIF